jgi:hypothetical protein
MMTPTEALITASRRYCKENFSYWCDRYARERTGINSPVYSYSDEDYNLFPRYNVLSAILGEVEELVGQHYPDITSCQEDLVLVGLAAESIFTKDVKNATAVSAMQEERDKFVNYVQTVTLGELGLIDPLPYRRRLKTSEKKEIRQRLLEIWNYEGDYWDPLVEKSPTEFLFLAKAHFTEQDHQSIVQFISRNTSSFLLEITEDGNDAEIAPSEFHPDCYETIYCDYDYLWIVYGSHEGTITFAGDQLLPFIKRLFAEREHLFNQWPIYN